MEMFLEQRTPEVVSQKRGQQHTQAIGEKVHPVPAAVLRAGGLQDLDASAHQNGADYGAYCQTFGGDTAVAEKIFHPEDRRQASVHADVYDFVDVRHFVQFSLWRVEEGQVANGCHYNQ